MHHAVFWRSVSTYARGDAVSVADTTDWAAVFFGDSTLGERLRRRTQRRFGATPDAQAAYNYALDAISDNDWLRLRNGFRGRGSAKGFLAVTFANLLEEYAVKKYGRRRPPAWVKRLGGNWVRAFEMLCLRRLLPETIVDALAGGEHARRDAARRMVQQVGSRIRDCGKYTGEELHADTAALMDQAHQANTPDDTMDAAAWRHLQGAVQAVFCGTVEDTATAELAPATADDAAVLTASQRLLLKLIYEDGYSVARAARALRWPTHRAHREHKSCLRRLQDCLTAAK